MSIPLFCFFFRTIYFPDVDGKEELQMDVSKLAAFPNTVFDESGNFLLYPTMLGIKGIFFCHT